MLYITDGLDEIEIVTDDTDDIDAMDTLATGLEFESIGYARTAARDIITIDKAYADLSDVLELCETLYIDVEVIE